jgi:hypothetical protein
MPDVERLLRTLEKAAVYFRETPVRKGLRLDLPPYVEELVIVGDLHGNVENFQRALRLANLGAHPRRHLVVQELLHGPFRYDAGGCRSHQLLDLIGALKCTYPERVHYVAGNHEMTELLGQPIVKDGERMDVAFARGLAHAYGPNASRVRDAYRALLASLPLVLVAPNGLVISHSLPSREVWDPERAARVLGASSLMELNVERGSPAYELLWGRDESEEATRHFLESLGGSLAITGHLPCREGYRLPNPYRLVLDASSHPACACLVSLKKPVTTDALQRGLVYLG